jgi:hypothetical protein
MGDKRYTRREFIRNVSLTAWQASSSSLLLRSKEEAEDFLQKHFEMTAKRRDRLQTCGTEIPAKRQEIDQNEKEVPRNPIWLA